MPSARPVLTYENTAKESADSDGLRTHYASFREIKTRLLDRAVSVINSK
jgi:hypothetical protein